MRLLLDTQIVYRTFYEQSRLSLQARQLMVDATEIYVSSASIWELAIKSRIGKIKADADRVIEKTLASGMIELPVFYRHAAMVATLPLHHADPFDRILIAQSIKEQLLLLTTDTHLRQYTDLVLQV